MVRDQGAHVCPKCSLKFPRERTLQAHIASRHSPRAVAGGALKLAGVAVAVIAAGALVYLLATAPAPPAPGLHLQGQPKLGNDTAPVVFVMFEDPDCPFCKRFHDNTFDALVAEFGDAGSVQFFYVENSGGNPWSLEGAIAQECAYRLGGDAAFWNVTRNFYRDQTAINGAAGSPKENVRPFALQYAAALGLDQAAFARCYDDAEPRDAVRSDYADARAVGARGTPAFVVKPRDRGEPHLISGAQPLAVFQQAIRSALAEAGGVGGAP